MKNFKWSKENTKKLLELWNLSWSVKDCACYFGITDERVKAKIKRLRARGIDVPTRKRRNVQLTEEEAIALVQEYKTEANYLANKENLPPINVIRRLFGSWRNAKEAANIKINNSHASVYLVYFPKEDFYKFVITQRTIARRFSAYPDYEILYEVILPFEEAKKLEQSFKKQAEDLFTPYTPNNRWFHEKCGGYSECFKTD